MAVGSYSNLSSTQATLAEHWNGRGWTSQAPPNPAGATSSSLSGVSCTTAGACTAVGSYANAAGAEVTLAEQWNGIAWSIQTTPNPTGATNSSLSGVSCVAAGCIAVGQSGATPLVEWWNGTSWMIQASPTGGGGLAQVSCTAATACSALGVGAALVERWNGSAWSSQAIAVPAGATSTAVDGVSCASATLCTAVGHWFSRRCINGQPTCNCFKVACTIKQPTLVERWNGSAWMIESTPSPGGLSNLSGVSCVSATACAAVGTAGNGSQTLAEQWDGTSWTIQTSPTAGPNGALTSVSCSRPTACAAVGQRSGVPLGEGWNGADWTVQSTPTPAGPSRPGLSGVSCATATSCTAVGSYTNASGTQVSLAENWNGTNWSAQTPPNPSVSTAASLSSVSCAAATACTAAGYDNNGGGNPPADFALAEDWDGTNWSLQATPSPGAGYNSALLGVSCTVTTTCMAVGYDYYAQGPQDAVLAEQWNGAAWAVQAPPTPTGAYSSVLFGVSCATATRCVAVGSSNISGTPQAVAEQWDGTAWTIQTPSNPTLSENTVLSAVSCTSATSCTAVGNYVDSATGTQMTLGERWNGSDWSIQTTPNPSGGGVLSSVSCTTATACTAVGRTSGATLAEQWNGSAWTIQPTPNPSGGGVLSSVSCTTATACTAVGQTNGTTLAERYTG